MRDTGFVVSRERDRRHDVWLVGEAVTWSCLARSSGADERPDDMTFDQAVRFVLDARRLSRVRSDAAA
jgi:hypothetical protein